MTQSDHDKVKQLLIATRFGVSATEIPMIIGVEQDTALNIIEALKVSGEDIHSVGAGQHPAELVLYSIGEIEP
ncbi:hypothetical protein [Motilimonas pumila]|uniref:Uncharacterized protein n=1 Tax=Motilimonas pumila TaxID=2303987 RepID=A0A418YFQ0_9GAMM|nr:hypothetical protein [Motilimonas pumila]RJG48205.1 hypothetical protein D1Z90_09060 [Motilimonas pumila]